MTSDDLKSHLKTLDWSQAEFARRVGVAPNTVYRWMAGLLPMPLWLTSYLDMALMVRRCVTGEAVLTVTGEPLAAYELADRIGIDYAPVFKDRQREKAQRLSHELRREWSPVEGSDEP